MKICQSCRNSEGCIGKEFYTPAEIRFCRYQVLWLLDNRGTLSVGRWPSNPDGSNYFDIPGKPKIKAKAYFEIPCSILAEVLFRLNRTGKDGTILLKSIKAGETFGELCYEARSALYYCSGWRRKHQSYSQWLADRRYKKAAYSYRR